MREISAFLGVLLYWAILTVALVSLVVVMAAGAHLGTMWLTTRLGIPSAEFWASGAVTLTLVLMLIGVAMAFLTALAEVKEAERKALDTRAPPKQGPSR